VFVFNTHCTIDFSSLQVYQYGTFHTDHTQKYANFKLTNNVVKYVLNNWRNRLAFTIITIKHTHNS